MLSLSSKEPYQSMSVPGAEYVVKRITEELRQEFRMQVAGIQGRIQELAAEQESLESEPEATRDKKRCKEIEKILTEIEDSELNPAWVRFFLIGITEKETGEAVQMDGVTLTPDNLKGTAPQALFGEVLTRIRSRAALGGAEVKNSESPSTSSAPVDGATPTTA
jgi:hypothetical protein